MLPETVDLERVRKGVSVLAEAVTAREQADALKRKADEEAAARAKRERAEKANASKLDELLSKPGGVSAALEASAAAGGGGGDDEEEDLLAAIEAYFAAHPECAGGRTYDAFEIERQQEIGKGGILVSSPHYQHQIPRPLRDSGQERRGRRMEGQEGRGPHD